jgi:dolichyl-phosphate-mannose-protein mannosyltransferase
LWCGGFAGREGCLHLTETSASSPGTWRAAIGITLGAGLLRLIIGAVTPLFPDEAYYWDWSRHLATGYFDHPPAIAWLIRAGTMIAGDTPLGVRLGPGIAATCGALFLALAARRIGGDRAALLASVVFAAMPLSAAGLVIATPDAPLLACVAAMVYSIARALEHVPRSSGSLVWWSVAGVSLGLGVTSKYTAVLVPLGVFVALLSSSHRELRPRLLEPGPYVATVVGVLVFSPVILWNATHHWASFAFQLRHGFGAAAGSTMGRELEFIGGQAGLVSPILFVLMVVAVMRGIKAPTSVVSRVLAVVVVVVFAFFMYSATKRRVEANWPAIAYVPGVLLLATHAGTRAWDRSMRGGVALAALLSAVVYVNAIVPVLPVPARRDPAARASGWDDLARVVDRVYAPRLSISSYRTWVAGDRYQEASALAFHLPNHPETFSLNLSSRPNQYDLWPRFAERAQPPRDILLLVVDDVEGTHPTVELLRPHFERVIKADAVTLARNGDPVKYLRVWHLERWRGTWPAPRLPSR